MEAEDFPEGAECTPKKAWAAADTAAMAPCSCEGGRPKQKIKTSEKQTNQKENKTETRKKTENAMRKQK